MKCLDTYALMAIAGGDAAFEKFVTEDFIIPDTTLAEFYWVLLRDTSEANAQTWISRIKPYSVVPGKELLLDATRFRFFHRKKDISFFDAVGYCFAKKNNLPFVTGDEQFRSFSGVEFIKQTR